MTKQRIDIKLTTHRVASDSQGNVLESDQPLGLDYALVTNLGLSFSMSQSRGISVQGYIGVDTLKEVMEQFSRSNPKVAKSLAFIMLGEASKIEIKEIQSE